MNKRIVILSVVCLLAAMLPVAAQTGLRQGDTVSFGNAEVYGSYISGGLKSASDAESSWTAGAVTEAVRHLGKFSMAGSFGFEQTEFYGMCGSMFIEPGFYPINVYEFTKGRKTLQRYNMSGGLSVDIAPHWRIGGEASYSTANMAKRKDLRHSNYRLDMAVAPGVMYYNGDFAIGADFIWSRNSETINAEQIGSTTTGYNAFFDKGLFYGVDQIWTGSGTHLSEAGVSGLPVSENLYGAGLQIYWGDVEAALQWRHRNGTAGEKQIVWYRFPGWDLTGNAGWSFEAGGLKHRVEAGMYLLDQNNYETILDKQIEGGITLTYEYGSNLLYSRRNLDLSAEYAVEAEKWTAVLRLAYASREGRAAPVYPYVIRQTLQIPSAQLDGSYRLGGFSLLLGLGGSFGIIDETSRTVSNTSGLTSEPLRLERYYAGYCDLLTSPVLTVRPGVRYDFGRGLYLQADGRWAQGFGIEVLPGTWRACGNIKLGYDF